MRTKPFNAGVKVFLALVILGALGLAGCATNPYAPYAGRGAPGYYYGVPSYYGAYGSPSYGNPYAYGYSGYDYWPGNAYSGYPDYWRYGPPVVIVNKPSRTTRPRPPPPIHPVASRPSPIRHRPIIRPCNLHRSRTVIACP